SGSGSEVANTGKIRTELPRVIENLKVESLLDVGCGDWNWMRLVELPCEYIGVDIVPSVIARNVAEFGATGRSFYVLDAVEEPLPDCDAIFLREVVFHLSFLDARKLLRNILQSRARFLFATTDSDTTANTDIRSGDFRILNLNLTPFCFPDPFMDIPDDGVCQARRIGVWKIDELRSSDVMK
ncbi:MAG: methyltransferase domain-containing protein, partial [Deltaproteobacteria bacterium]